MKSTPYPNNKKIQINRQAILMWILLLSTALRIGCAVYLGDEVVELPGTADQISYHTLAVRVLSGNGFSFDQPWWPATTAGEPTAHWSFIYTFYLVFVYSIFGVHPIAARIIQVLIVGMLHPFLAFWIGKKVFGEATGLIAAAITGGYAYFIYYSACLMTEPFYITAILGIIASSYKIILSRKKPLSRNLPRYVLLGVLFGYAVLLRQLFLAIIPLILLWIFWSFGTKRIWQSFTCLIISGAFIVVMIAPFTVYNYNRFNRFVLLNTNSGYAFFFGNHPIYGTQFVPILTEDLGSYHDLIPPELLSLDEAALDQELLKRGLQFVVDDPTRYVLLSLSRIPAYFMFWPSPDSGLLSNVARVASFGLFLPFILLGFLLAILRGHFRKLSRPEWLLLIFMLAYTGIHLLSWTLVRYRLPVDAIAILFAAMAIHHVFRLSTRRINLPVQRTA